MLSKDSLLKWSMGFEKAEQMDILAGNAIKTDHEEQSLALALQPKYVHMVTLDPEDLSPSQLISFMRYMDEYSQVPKTYQLAFWQSCFAIFTHCISSRGVFFYFWTITPTIYGFPFGNRIVYWFEFLLFAGFLGLCELGLFSISSMVRTCAYLANVWCRKLFALPRSLEIVIFMVFINRGYW